MIVEIKIPSPGESITEVEIGSWLVADGDYVEQDQEIAEIESDKATLPLVAEKPGTVRIKVEAGETVAVGSVACTIDASAAQPQQNAVEKPQQAPEPALGASQPDSKAIAPAQPAVAAGLEHVKISPVAKKVMEENSLSVEDVINGLKRLSKKEVEAVLAAPQATAATAAPQAKVVGERNVERKKMTSLRKKISQRLVAVKNETAMLTTFNEIDMSNVMALRAKHQKQFVEKYGIKVGFMSFFTKAVTEALKLHPAVNSMIDGDEIITHHYSDIGIAAQTPKGLMVPVVRNADTLSLAEIELTIKELATKARAGKISIDEISGGTFTITNGGVFGSMLSTPIINPPQSGILGMHNIVERPVAIDGKVEIRPIMYVALSYDHRIIDGKDSVGFLVKVKEMIESPQKLLSAGQDPEKYLLGI